MTAVSLRPGEYVISAAAARSPRFLALLETLNAPETETP